MIRVSSTTTLVRVRVQASVAEMQRILLRAGVCGPLLRASRHPTPRPVLVVAHNLGRAGIDDHPSQIIFGDT